MQWMVKIVIQVFTYHSVDRQIILNVYSDGKYVWYEQHDIVKLSCTNIANEHYLQCFVAKANHCSVIIESISDCSMCVHT